MTRREQPARTPAEQPGPVETAAAAALLEALPVVVCSYDLQATCTSLRGRGLDELGLKPDQLVGVQLLEEFADFPVILEGLRRSLAGEAITLTVDLYGRLLTAHYRPQLDDAGTVVSGLVVSLDVTGLAAAEQQVRRRDAHMRAILQHASDVAVVVDRAGAISYVSPAARLQLGYPYERLVGTAAADLVHPDDRPLVQGAWEAIACTAGDTASCECRVRHADGSWVWTEQMFTNLLDDPVIGGVVVNIRETTERRRIDEDLRRLALQDGLTGLANRSLLLDRTRQALRREHKAESLTGLIVLDVVGLHAINQRLGQAGGDVVLREVAQRLSAAARPTDSVARVGGDEFAVLCADLASAEDLRARVSTLLEALDEAVLVEERPVRVRLQAGTSMSPTANEDALLAAAERAVRAESGGQTSADAEEQERIEALRQGIAAGDLRLHYQPVLEVVSGRIAGAEALVRWQHPTDGLLPPSDFIPLAERSGLVVPLGEWVLREACASLAAWQREGLPWGVGVNVSPRQLVEADFPAFVSKVLAETGARADRLVIEVTESTLMDDPAAPQVLEALREQGVRLALDDFGTGYSSLTYLRRFTVDAIKIDRSFVAGLGRDPDDDAIVASIVSLARAVGKLVVAEGVVTAGQLQALRDLGVDQAQGFLWTRALPFDELAAWVSAWPQPRATAAAPRPEAPVRPEARVAAGTPEAQILALHLEGASLHTIAAALNSDGSRTAHGARWTSTSVARVVAGLVRS